MPKSELTADQLQELTNRLLQSLDSRSQDIVNRRFGIANGQIETLDSIGKSYNITRERVRQIEAQAKKSLTALTVDLEPVDTIFREIFAEYGGILSEDHIIEIARLLLQKPDLFASHVWFYLEILPVYTYVSRDPQFAPHWRHPEFVSKKAATIVDTAQAALQQTSHPLPEEELFQAISRALRVPVQEIPTQQVTAHLRASKHISQTPFGQWGLSHWPETNPRGVGDKGYAVLRRHGKPEHFTRITDLINEAQFDHKQANAQTVHNELIKDDRFVLVGRGLYGLAEWGYIPGTVSDVLESLLDQSQSPLTVDELVAKVLEQRQVKKNTILLGLQNSKRFVKIADNRYTLKEKS